MKKIVLMGLSACLIGMLQAQTFSDAIMMKKNEICFAFMIDQGKWNQYWEGSTLIQNDNIGTFTRNTYMPMLAYGITKNLNILIAAPFVSTESSGGQLAGVSGFQDINLALKYEAIKKDFGKHRVSALAVTQFGTPMTNYLSDYMPYSLGLGTQEFTGRVIGQYEYDKRIYFRSSVAYVWRGLTEVERPYYYNNGSYYTTFMDVPSAMNYQAVLGGWALNHNLRLEASFNVLNCLYGDDIRRWNMPQPTNKMEMTQAAVFAQYYLKSIEPLKGFSLMAAYGQVVAGRNMGKSANVSGGITYQFTF
ncbi:MAG TPA: transporter [Cyclobacteriaceae bacterium]|nr:transporter [Cyclobacteriaceae bacterium]